MILSYPFSWLSLALTVGVVVLLNAYLALLAVAVILLVALVLTVGLIGLAAPELYALGTAR